MFYGTIVVRVSVCDNHPRLLFCTHLALMHCRLFCLIASAHCLHAGASFCPGLAQQPGLQCAALHVFVLAAKVLQIHHVFV